MSKKLWSVFTDDMDHCYFTGTYPVERHHIFGSSDRICILTERREAPMQKKLI